tara:strand:- start:1365 stop:2036 length:672 start_codon:yes stop_codon:yes gene_type:complete
VFESNNIDIFLKREELLEVFHELIIQIEKNQLLGKAKFKIINHLNKNRFNPIIILDEISLKETISKDFNLNNHVFVIGELDKKTIENLTSNYINYEFIESPINFLNVINKCINLIEQKNNFLSEIVKFKKFSYSFQLNIIYTAQHSLYLTDKENEIFKSLVDNIKVPLNKKQLLSMVWNYSDDIDTHTLETHIYTLRKKIKKKLNFSNLINHEDNGYLLNETI